MNHRTLLFISFALFINQIECSSEKRITLDLYGDEDEKSEQDVSFNTRGFEKIKISIEDSYHSFALTDVYNAISKACFPLCVALCAFLVYKKSPSIIEPTKEKSEKLVCDECTFPLITQHVPGGR